MTITAKYAALCPACNGPINTGDKIEWERGSKARHKACVASDPGKGAYSGAALARLRSPQRGGSGKGRRGTWTGCACGSVEEYARDSDCASCQHDR